MNGISEKYSGKNIVICLPGNRYSHNFMCKLIELSVALKSAGINISLSQGSSPEIHQLRCCVGGGSHNFGLYQRPFGNQLSYDYLFWIDSDIDFTIKNFEDLIEMDKDVATGWYYQADGLPVAGYFIERYLKYPEEEVPLPLYNKDYIYSFLNDESIVNKTEPYPVHWCGMGWMLIKRGVMEKLKFPWFAPKIVRYNLSEAYEVLSEDLSFALNLRDAGIEMWVNPLIKVGHEKPRIF
jgi:hypothetical protein